MTLYAFGMRFAAPVFRFLLHVRIKNAENVPNGPVVVCANHRSNLDPVMLGAACPRQLHYMAKMELFHVPLLGPLITALGAFPVRRGEGDQGAMQTATRVLERGKALGMFPEMHRNRKRGLMRFHSGALRLAVQTGAPLLPVAIARGRGFWPFRAVQVIFGEPVTAEELGYCKGDVGSMHDACVHLRQKVAQILEERP